MKKRTDGIGYLIAIIALAVTGALASTGMLTAALSLFGLQRDESGSPIPEYMVASVTAAVGLIAAIVQIVIILFNSRRKDIEGRQGALKEIDEYKRGFYRIYLCKRYLPKANEASNRREYIELFARNLKSAGTTIWNGKFIRISKEPRIAFLQAESILDNSMLHLERYRFHVNKSGLLSKELIDESGVDGDFSNAVNTMKPYLDFCANDDDCDINYLFSYRNEEKRKEE